jgi:hypothetical protein
MGGMGRIAIRPYEAGRGKQRPYQKRGQRVRRAEWGVSQYAPTKLGAASSAPTKNAVSG